MIDDSIARKIELYLFEHGDWVHAAELEKIFNVTERQLRGIDDEPGYCSQIAISSSKRGYKHIDRASSEEYRKMKCERRKRAINELRNLRALDRRRHDTVRKLKIGTFEKDTGQGIFIRFESGSTVTCPPAHQETSRGHS